MSIIPQNEGTVKLMPRKCSICSHEQVAEINRMIIEDSEPNTKIATIFGVTESAIRRHKESHIPATMAKSHLTLEMAMADDLVARAGRLEEKAWELLRRAEGEGDIRAAIQGIKAALGCAELRGKATGELNSDRVLIMITPVIQEIVHVIREEVGTDPEVIERIRERLLLLGGGNNVE